MSLHEILDNCFYEEITQKYIKCIFECIEKLCDFRYNLADAVRKHYKQDFNDYYDKTSFAWHDISSCRSLKNIGIISTFESNGEILDYRKKKTFLWQNNLYRIKQINFN